MIHLFRSFIFFISLIFKNKFFSVVFYYPQHFNRSNNGENLFFKHLYTACKKHNLTFLIIEEPDFRAVQKRGAHTTPFDFIYILIVLLRKLQISDIIIGKIFRKTLMRGLKFNNCIVLSQSMLSFFRGLGNNVNIFDMQHGIIFSQKESYVYHGKVSSNLEINKVKLLLFGDKFRKILLKNDSSNYLYKNSFVIGISRSEQKILHNNTNNNILVTLQFTDDHNTRENHLIADELEEFIKHHSEYNFFLKNHPRFNNEINLNRFYKYHNVRQSNSILECCFQNCSIHLTSYSTVTFDCAYFGIPTIFLKSLNFKFDMFYKEFQYPLLNNLDFIENNYQDISLRVQDWERGYYVKFNEKKFISLII